ncbi:MAG TPA: RagB/SusD family nutrient uptake outer membrane protein, partial [Paludibacteraceae bacterium]|nr:RagB/SusD family nutrient uptake outer membrane protein [Paludibacteraceae bacterium]
MNLKHIKYYSLVALTAVTFGATSCIGDLDVTPINPQVTQTFDKDAVFAKVYTAFSLTGQQGAAGNNDIDIPDEGRYSLYRCLWNQNEL